MNERQKKILSGFGGRGDRIMSNLVRSVSMVGILIMLFILGFLVTNGMPVLRKSTLSEIFLSRDWYPVEEPPALGMLPLIAGTLSATLLSSLIALPIAVALAIFTAEIAPRRLRSFFKVMMELMGFLPSIVLGFIGMMDLICLMLRSSWVF